MSFEYTVCDNGSPSECSEMTADSERHGSPRSTTLPGFTGADQTVAEDSGPHGVSGWASGISAGPADESDAQLTFEVTNNTNTGLFSTQPSVAADGTLSYALAADENGSADVTVWLKDDGGIANGGADTSAEQTFTIDVRAGTTRRRSAICKVMAPPTRAISRPTPSTSPTWIAAPSLPQSTAAVRARVLVVGSVQITATNGEFECEFLDGLASPTPVNISVRVSDGDKLSNVESKSVSVGNVAPAPTGGRSSSQNVLAGTLNPVTFTGTATDVSPIDLATGVQLAVGDRRRRLRPVRSRWRQHLHGRRRQQPALLLHLRHPHRRGTGRRQGRRRVGRVAQSTQSVSVYDGAFDPPLVDGTTNMVQKGQVIPVEISVGCGTQPDQPDSHIQLLSGNVSPELNPGARP